MRRPTIANLVDAGLAEARPLGAPPMGLWARDDDGCDCGGGCGSGASACSCSADTNGCAASGCSAHGEAIGGAALGGGFQLGETGVGSLGGTYVDVYLSAGPNEGPEQSCDTKSDSNCSLYRVRVNLAEMRVVEVDLVVAGGFEYLGARWGVVQPALSPSGLRMAYVIRSRDTSVLLGRTLRGSGATIVDIGSEGEDGDESERPQFPNWHSNDLLLYHKGPESGRTLYGADVEHTRPLFFGAPRPLLGAAAEVSSDTSFADAATRRKDSGPKSSEPRLFPSRDVVTFGVSPSTSEAPRVHALSPGPFGSLNTEEFELGTNRLGNSIDECHHPAWNIGGDEILCTAYRSRVGGVEKYPDELGKPTRMLYSYSRSSVGWSQVGAKTTFLPLTPDELVSEFGDQFPTDQCHLYTYKFAEWCGSDNYVVATLYCTKERTEEMVSSRVMLIRRSPVRYLDLTGAIEEWFEERFGARERFHGVFATCTATQQSL